MAQKDYWESTYYIADNWPSSVLEKFQRDLAVKMELIASNPDVGFKSGKYSKFRKTVVAKHYVLIYSEDKGRVVVHRLKHIKSK